MFRNRAIRFMAVAATAFLLAAASADAALAAKKRPDAPGDAVLIVAFGTSFEKARASYDALEREVRKSCPGKDIRWAWTAHSLLGAGPGGSRMLSPQEALARLATEGVKNVDILSLHVIPGQEYSNLAATARAFEGLPKGLERVRVSPPLLWDTQSMGDTAALLLRSLPQARKADEGVVFVGHGTHHPAGVYYGALQYYLGRLDANVFVGTVEGDPDFDAVLGALRAKKLKRVWLVPLMTVAGDHASNDLFGDEKDSWKQRFAAAGLTVETVRRGLGEVPEIAGRWVEGLTRLAD